MDWDWASSVSSDAVKRLQSPQFCGHETGEHQRMAIQAIGKPAPKVEGVDKVTGRARYTADIPIEGALWGRVLHSPYAHARILSIDTSAARALPGVHAVITGDDAGPGYYGTLLKDVP